MALDGLQPRRLQEPDIMEEADVAASQTLRPLVLSLLWLHHLICGSKLKTNAKIDHYLN